MDYEYETTCGIFFDGSLYGIIENELLSKCKAESVEESVDVYKDPDEKNGRYRESTIFESPLSANDVPAKRKWDHKKTVYVEETQMPFLEETNGRVVFVTCTYKVSSERPMTHTEWKNTVIEDHTSGHYARIKNKRRISFYKGAFKTQKDYTRVSIGELSTYGGTLEARSTCNSIYFLEIEHETRKQLDRLSIRRSMNQLNELLFELIPYDLVRRSMIASNSCSIQRERIDNIFDAFKRTFQNYSNRSSYLQDLVRNETNNGLKLDFFVMPKWDGVRAVGLYFCEGHLLVKDAYGRLVSFNTHLPFDNDMVFQIEVVSHEQRGDNGKDLGYLDSGGRYYVINELMAVLIKSQNTMFPVYGRNTIAHDTCRNIGNIVDGVSVKTQFENHTHICNLYRLLDAETSLRVLSEMTKVERINICGSDIVILTGVVNVPVSNSKLLKRVDDFFALEGRERKRQSLSVLSKWLPARVRKAPRFLYNCEGLILAYTLFENIRPCKKVNGVVCIRAKNGMIKNTNHHGYFKLKDVATVDLELNLNDGSLTSADGTVYTAEGLPTMMTKVDDKEDDGSNHIRGWAERPVPMENRRVIVECLFDGKGLKFYRDRSDKSRPDADSKIIATDKAIYSNCRLEKYI